MVGLDDFGGSEFEEGLELFCAGLRSNVVTEFGRDLLAGDCQRYLENRLRVVEYRKARPDTAAGEVRAPIVILGLPRTGTTAVSYMLDRDPQWRCLLNWEAVDSVPPPTAETLRSDTRCTDALEFQRAILPTLDPQPPHWEWADGPTECTFLLAQDFKAVMWESRVPNPAYREFISSCDMTSAYQYHRWVLQVLQSDAPGTWCLKMPAHAYFIDALLDTYPDARIIWTHRDPATATASFMNLIAFAHRLSLGEPDIDWIVDTYPDRLVEQVRRPMEALAGRNVYHLHFHRYLSDPLAEMRRIYDWLGVSLEDAVAQDMSGWLEADPLHASRQAYSLADFGLERTDLLQSFAAYIEAFGVDLDA